MTRESIYRSLFGHDKATYRKIARTGLIEHCLTPVYMILHGLIIGSTWFMSKVTWGGVRYKVGGVNKTRVLKRKAIESLGNSSIGELSLPAGAAVAAGFGATGFRVRYGTRKPASPPPRSRHRAGFDRRSTLIPTTALRLRSGGRNRSQGKRSTRRNRSTFRSHGERGPRQRFRWEPAQFTVFDLLGGMPAAPARESGPCSCLMTEDPQTFEQETGFRARKSNGRKKRSRRFQ